MAIAPRIDGIVQASPYFGHRPGNPSADPAGSVLVTGHADPDISIVLTDIRFGATLATVMTAVDGSWFVGLSFFHAPPLQAGLHDLVVTTYPNGYPGPAGASSGTTEVAVGTDGADRLAGPVLSAGITGPTYLFTGAGDDVIAAYSVEPDGAGRHANGVSIVLDGGRDTSEGGVDIAVIPVGLSELESRVRAGSATGGSPTLVLHTADATVTLLQIERIAFSDFTLTVQADPLVDFLFYDLTYRDMAMADTVARAHYDAHGWHEGRDPNALFSTRGYVAAYADVGKAGLNPLNHYDADGWREGRNPSAAFDTALYLRFNPDVAAAGVDPLLHYLVIGEAEGRRAFPAIGSVMVQDGFDPLYYRLANPDVSEAGLEARAHFETFGSREGRNPDAFFDTNLYRAHNPDVAAAGIDPLAHYNTFGWQEGRDPSSHFDTRAYLSAYADVAATGLNPLQHFLQYGAAEGRSGFGDLF